MLNLLCALLLVLLLQIQVNERTVCTGSTSEMRTLGGEVAFISAIIYDSLMLKDRYVAYRFNAVMLLIFFYDDYHSRSVYLFELTKLNCFFLLNQGSVVHKHGGQTLFLAALEAPPHCLGGAALTLLRHYLVAGHHEPLGAGLDV